MARASLPPDWLVIINSNGILVKLIYGFRKIKMKIVRRKKMNADVIHIRIQVKLITLSSYWQSQPLMC